MRFGRWLQLAASEVSTRVHALQVVLSGATGTLAEVDAISNNLIHIDTVHAHIHDGHHYQYINYVTLNVGQTSDFVFQTPSTTARVHGVIEATSTAQVILACYEDSAANADGTLVTAINSNRNSANVAGAVIRIDPTVTDVGSLMFQETIGAGSNPGQSRIGTLGRENELVLEANKKYLCRLTSEAQGARVTYRYFWYEH